jgi:hypothetical protein
MTALAEDTTTGAPARPRVGWRVVLVAVLVGALVAGSGVLVVVRDDRRRVDDEALGAAKDRVTAAIADLAGPMSAARTALDSSARRVDDERVRSELAAALDSARAAVDAEAISAAELDSLAGRLIASRDELTTRTDVVTSAVAAWDLDHARAARALALARLDAALWAARAVLDSSAGRVQDDAARAALAAALDSAQAQRDAPAPSDAAALRASATALASAADSLATPQAAVVTAVAGWEQAQDAAAAGAASATGRAAPHQSAPTKTAPSSPASPPPTTNEGHWETTVTYEDLRLCMDTEGNSWEC